MDDHRLPELRGELELLLEDAPLVLVRCVIAKEVEPDLTDGDDVAPDDGACVLAVGRLVRVNAGRDPDAAFGGGDRTCRTRRRGPGPDRDDPVDAHSPRPVERGRRIVERVEVRVGVDHTGSSFLNNGVGSRSFCPSGGALGPQPRRHVA